MGCEFVWVDDDLYFWFLVFMDVGVGDVRDVFEFGFDLIFGEFF